MTTPLTKAIAQAIHDPVFRSRLLSEPKQTLLMMNISLPNDQNVTVVESNERQNFFVLPLMSDADIKHLHDSLSSVHHQRALRSRILIQAAQDSDYKARLIANPKSVLQAEGMTIPATTKLKVLENTMQQLYLVIPSLHT